MTTNKRTIIMFLIMLLFINCKSRIKKNTDNPFSIKNENNKINVKVNESKFLRDTLFLNLKIKNRDKAIWFPISYEADLATLSYPLMSTKNNIVYISFKPFVSKMVEDYYRVNDSIWFYGKPPTSYCVPPYESLQDAIKFICIQGEKEIVLKVPIKEKLYQLSPLNIKLFYGFSIDDSVNNISSKLECDRVLFIEPRKESFKSYDFNNFIEIIDSPAGAN